MKKDQVVIIEGLCYLFPHKKELFEGSLSMHSTWRECLRLSRQKGHRYFAPLLVDDLVRAKNASEQSVESLLKVTIGKTYASLPWFGPSVLESDIEKQYGNLGCKKFDAIYHRDVLFSVGLITHDWKWIAVHPEFLKAQQSGMLLDLWNLFAENIDFGSLARMSMKRASVVRDTLRDEFLSRFEHRWIALDGTLSSVTRPVYRGKKIVHVLV